MKRIISLEVHKAAGCAQENICLSFNLEHSSNLGCLLFIYFLWFFSPARYGNGLHADEVS
jgi:hypothetical protein